MKKAELGMLVAGILLGILPGYYLGKVELRDSAAVTSQIPEPKTSGECAYAISQARTETGAEMLWEWCNEAFRKQDGK